MTVFKIIASILFFAAVIASLVRLIVRKKAVFTIGQYKKLDVVVLGLYLLAAASYAIGT